MPRSPLPPLSAVSSKWPQVAKAQKCVTSAVGEDPPSKCGAASAAAWAMKARVFPQGSNHKSRFLTDSVLIA